MEKKTPARSRFRFTGKNRSTINLFIILACILASLYIGFYFLYSNRNLNSRLCEGGQQSVVTVDGDEALGDYCSIGNGSQENPYIIEDLVIDDECVSYGIQISNVRKHLVIQNCTISSIAARFGPTDVLHTSGGIKIASSANVIVRNCSIVSCKENGILGLDIENVVIENSTISGIDFCGIKLDGARNTTIRHTILQDNDFGLMLYDNWNAFVHTNEVKNNDYNGIEVDVSNYNTIENNTVSCNSNSGIYLINADNNLIAGNHVENNTLDGIVLNSANNNIIIGNKVRNNMHNGLFLNYYWIADSVQTYYHCSKNNNVTENFITDNDIGVLMVRASENELINNTINNNIKYAIQLAISSGNVIHENALTGCIAMDSNSTGNDIFPETCLDLVEYTEDNGFPPVDIYLMLMLVCVAIACASILFAVIIYKKHHKRPSRH